MNLYKKIIVNNWINNKKFKTYDIYLYEDDNLDDACSKIAKTINNNLFVGSTAELQKVISEMKNGGSSTQ